MDDGGAGLVVLLLADPHLLEGGQGGQDGASDPDRVFTLWWGDDLRGDGNTLGTRASRGTEREETQSISSSLNAASLTLIFMVLGAREVISFCMRSAMPGYMVVPPDSTVLAYRSLRMSTSHFMMLL